MWGRTGGLNPLPPGFNPPPPYPARPNFSSLPPPLFFLIFFFRVPPPKIPIFCPRPRPSDPRPPPIFRQKPPYPQTPGPPTPCPPPHIYIYKHVCVGGGGGERGGERGRGGRVVQKGIGLLNLRASTFSPVNKMNPQCILTLWRLLHMFLHFDPPLSGLWKICIVSTPIFSKNEENVVFRPLFFIKIGQNV